MGVNNTKKTRRQYCTTGQKKELDDFLVIENFYLNV